jgi:hypothetical protein
MGCDRSGLFGGFQMLAEHCEMLGRWLVLSNLFQKSLQTHKTRKDLLLDTKKMNLFFVITSGIYFNG